MCNAIALRRTICRIRIRTTHSTLNTARCDSSSFNTARCDSARYCTRRTDTNAFSFLSFAFRTDNFYKRVAVRAALFALQENETQSCTKTQLPQLPKSMQASCETLLHHAWPVLGKENRIRRSGSRRNVRRRRLPLLPLFFSSPLLGVP